MVGSQTRRQSSKKAKSNNGDSSTTLELWNPKAGTEAVQVQAGGGEIEKYSHVEFHNHKIVWKPGYFVLAVEGENLVVVEHVYSENNKGEKFSNIPIPFRVSRDRVRLSEEKPPEIKPRGWYKTTPEFLEFWAPRVIKSYGILDLNS